MRVRAPRVAEAPVSLECRLSQIIDVGRRPYQLILGEIVYFHIRDELYSAETGRIDMHNLHPVARLAGEMYGRVHDVYAMKRPSPNYQG